MKKIAGLLLLLLITSYAISGGNGETTEWEYYDNVCPYPIGICGIPSSN